MILDKKITIYQSGELKCNLFKLYRKQKYEEVYEYLNKKIEDECDTNSRALMAFKERLINNRNVFNKTSFIEVIKKIFMTIASVLLGMSTSLYILMFNISSDISKSIEFGKLIEYQGHIVRNTAEQIFGLGMICFVIVVIISGCEEILNPYKRKWKNFVDFCLREVENKEITS